MTVAAEVDGEEAARWDCDGSWGEGGGSRALGGKRGQVEAAGGGGMEGKRSE